MNYLGIGRILWANNISAWKGGIVLIKNLLKNLKFNEGNISTVMGIAVMLLTGFLLVQYFRSVNKAPVGEKTLSTSTEQSALALATPSATVKPTTTVKPTVTIKPTTKVATPTIVKAVVSPTPAPVVKPGSEYVVQAGDSLWKISMKTYGQGDQWVKVYQSNKTTLGDNPSLIAVGTKLTLPQLEVAKTTDVKVVKGDNLWSISAAVCGDGSVWNQIASQNNLVNPRLIHPGNVLKITCPRK